MLFPCHDVSYDVIIKEKHLIQGGNPYTSKRCVLMCASLIFFHRLP